MDRTHDPVRSAMTAAVLLAGFLSAVGSAPAYGQEPSPNKISFAVAVLDFDAQDRQAGREIGTLLASHLTREKDFIVVDRQKLEELLRGQKIGPSGTIGKAQAAKVGYLTGAKVLVTGSISDTGQQRTVIADIMGTETGRIYDAFVTTSSKHALTEVSQELAAQIGATIRKNATSLLAKVETKGELIARLKKSIAGRRLPTASIRIGEKHPDRGTTDPAAQAEVASLLEELGFEILDSDQTATAPEITIEGQAISEFGSRQGNMVSCLARVEIKAIDRSTGAILAEDRQAEVAVAFGEQMAAEAAVEKAAAKLVERIVQQIVEA